MSGGGGEATMLNLRSRFRDEEGQDVIEYGLLAAFISVVAIVTIRAIGPLVNDLYVKINDAF
jgi:Flp pilus assembly pilin Flp